MTNHQGTHLVSTTTNTRQTISIPHKLNSFMLKNLEIKRKYRKIYTSEYTKHFSPKKAQTQRENIPFQATRFCVQLSIDIRTVHNVLFSSKLNYFFCYLSRV